MSTLFCAKKSMQYSVGVSYKLYYVENLCETVVQYKYRNTCGTGLPDNKVNIYNILPST